MTLNLHTIRLRGPWQLEAIARFAVGTDGRCEVVGDVLKLTARATMPADWSGAFGADFLGRVRYVRTFQKPTGLEADERVWLVVEPPRSLGRVRLGDRELGSVAFGGRNGRFDVTSLLAEPNTLEIVVEHPAPDGDSITDGAAGGLVGEVRLEIEPAN